MFERVSTNPIAAATHQAEAESLASKWPASAWQPHAHAGESPSDQS